MLELPYIAGLVDGEGCISIAKRQRTRTKGKANYEARLDITNTNLEVLTLCLEQLGGSITHKSRKGCPLVWKPCHVWLLSENPACILIEKLLPFLVIKKQQATLMLAFHRKKKSYQGRSNIPNEEAAFREECFQEMRRLNK